MNTAERRETGQTVGQREPLSFTPKGALESLTVQSLILGWQVFPTCLGTCSQLLLT